MFHTISHTIFVHMYCTNFTFSLGLIRDKREVDMVVVTFCVFNITNGTQVIIILYLFCLFNWFSQGQRGRNHVGHRWCDLLYIYNYIYIFNTTYNSYYTQAIIYFTFSVGSVRGKGEETMADLTFCM